MSKRKSLTNEECVKAFEKAFEGVAFDEQPPTMCSIQNEQMLRDVTVHGTAVAVNNRRVDPAALYPEAPRAWFTIDELNAWADKKLKDNPQWAERPHEFKCPLCYDDPANIKQPAHPDYIPKGWKPAVYVASLEAELEKHKATQQQEHVAYASAWFALVMNAAAELEDASNCLRDEDAKLVAISGAKYYRDAAKKLYTSPPAQQQEPAGAVYRYGKDSSGKPWHGIRWTASGLDLPDGTLVYTSPPAQQQKPKFSARDDAERLKSVGRGMSYNDASEAVWKHTLMEIAMRLETGGYTPPPARKPLTDEQIQECWYRTQGEAENFARAIEAAHGIKGDA